MKTRPLLISALLMLLSFNTSFGDEAWVVRPDGVGPVRIGMTLAQLNKALEENFAAPAAKDQADCFYVSTSKPAKLLFMMLEGRVARIDVREPGVKTASGIQVGDSEAKARKVYGSRLKVEPQKYVEHGHYLTVTTSDGRRGIRFEAADGKITSYYAGRDQAIQLVEGCQ